MTDGPTKGWQAYCTGNKLKDSEHPDQGTVPCDWFGGIWTYTDLVTETSAIHSAAQEGVDHVALEALYTMVSGVSDIKHTIDLSEVSG